MIYPALLIAFVLTALGLLLSFRGSNGGANVFFLFATAFLTAAATAAHFIPPPLITGHPELFYAVTGTWFILLLLSAIRNQSVLENRVSTAEAKLRTRELDRRNGSNFIFDYYDDEENS